MFGSGKSCQLGLISLSEALFPVALAPPEPSDVWAAVSCGHNHTLGATSSGALYSWVLTLLRVFKAEVYMLPRDGLAQVDWAETVLTKKAKAVPSREYRSIP
jgi:alpha-tubulin suppressor-like RCC1 family protein